MNRDKVAKVSLGFDVISHKVWLRIVSRKEQRKSATCFSVCYMLARTCFKQYLEQSKHLIDAGNKEWLQAEGELPE